jgi:hypothetical protein
MAYLLCISFLSPTFSLIQNYPHSPLENRNFNSKNLFIPPKSLIKSPSPPPSTYQTRIETPICEWKFPHLSTHSLLAKTRKTPLSSPLSRRSPRFSPIGSVFRLEKSPIQMCIYISICVEKKDWGRKSPSVSK